MVTFVMRTATLGMIPIEDGGSHGGLERDLVPSLLCRAAERKIPEAVHPSRAVLASNKISSHLEDAMFGTFQQQDIYGSKATFGD